MSNDFLPFAVGGSANVITQSAYAALTSLLQTGFSAGIAQSNQLNKVWRQSSIMAAVLAQFIVDQSGQNAVDDGTTATLEANLLAAIRNASKQTVILTDTGTANAYAAANTPALTVLPGTGYVQRVNIAHANTGASTYAPDGLTAKPIYGLGLQALQGGELPVGIAVLMYLVQAGVNGGNGAWIIIESLGGAQQIPAATQSQHAVQLGQIQAQAFGYAADTGAANAIVVAPSPAFTSFPPAGTPLRIKVAAANTGATTVAISGLSAAAVQDSAGNALLGGEFKASGIYNFVSDGTHLRIAPTQGRLINVQTFSSSGTYTPSIGMGSVRVTMIGGGGGGSGVPATSSGQSAAGGGGGSGAFGIGLFTAAQIGASQVVTIGAAGVGGSNTNGGTGGTTSLGALMSCAGGGGASFVGPTGAGAVGGSGIAGGSVSGANIMGSPGTLGAPGIITVAASTFLGGNGAAGIFGAGAGQGASNGTGGAGGGFGSGGGGVANGASSGGYTGGNGAKGIMIIEEFA